MFFFVDATAQRLGFAETASVLFNYRTSYSDFITPQRDRSYILRPNRCVRIVTYLA